MSTEWSRPHRLFLHRHSLPTATPDVLSCLQLVLPHLSHLWKFRNHQRHSSTSSTHLSELTRQIHQQITDLYRYRHSVLPTDKHIFHRSLSTHLKQSLTSLQAWVLNHSHYILHSHQEAQQTQTTLTHPITHYFSSIS